MNFKEIFEDMARLEQRENVACCFEQILAATLPKTAAMQPLTNHFTNLSSKMKQTYRVLQEK